MTKLPKNTKSIYCNHKRLTVGLIIAVLSGCASQESLIENTSFNTKITDSGLKHFEIYLAKRPPELSSAKEKIDLPKNGRPPIRPKRGSRSPKQLNKITEIYIETTQYCRTGYWIMEMDTYRPVPRVRGECNEAATDEDRKKFPNSIQRW
ncbi:hypothetical protein TDB9533_00416 [Thalassocella blandensis]|nr:hypothetical protein TDB9533_00416 [Thalassocella blandensis]